MHSWQSVRRVTLRPSLSPALPSTTTLDVVKCTHTLHNLFIMHMHVHLQLLGGNKGCDIADTFKYLLISTLQGVQGVGLFALSSVLHPSLSASASRPGSQFSWLAGSLLGDPGVRRRGKEKEGCYLLACVLVASPPTGQTNNGPSCHRVTLPHGPGKSLGVLQDSCCCQSLGCFFPCVGFSAFPRPVKQIFCFLFSTLDPGRHTGFALFFWYRTAKGLK